MIRKNRIVVQYSYLRLICRIEDVNRLCFVCQAEDGIRDLVRSRGLGDVYKRQALNQPKLITVFSTAKSQMIKMKYHSPKRRNSKNCCLLYTSDAADERSSVDLGGRRIIKKKNNVH